MSPPGHHVPAGDGSACGDPAVTDGRTEDRQPEPELQDHYRDVLDHVLRLSERIAAFRALLQNALAVNAALVAQRQNDEMRLLTESSYAQNEQVKRISSWAAILFAPTRSAPSME